ARPRGPISPTSSALPGPSRRLSAETVRLPAPPEHQHAWGWHERSRVLYRGGHDANRAGDGDLAHRGAGWPMVVGHAPTQPDRPTVLLSRHYDVQRRIRGRGGPRRPSSQRSVAGGATRAGRETTRGSTSPTCWRWRHGWPAAARCLAT